MRADAVKSAARGRWRSLLPALGIPAAALTGKHGPCPCCGGTDRFRFDDRGGDGRYFCSRCGPGDGFNLIMRTRKIAFGEAARLVAEHLPSAPIVVPKAAQGSRKTYDLWPRGLPLVADFDAAAKYLDRRGLKFRDGFPPKEIRFLAAATYHDNGGLRSQHPAMIARFVAPDAKSWTTHLTYLTPDGDKAAVPSVRKFAPGPIPKGGAVRLAYTNGSDTLGVGEGIETCLAASMLFDLPVWACLSAGNLQKWQPPSTIKHVLIFGDNDASFTGQPRPTGSPRGSRRRASPSKCGSRRPSAATGMITLSGLGRAASRDARAYLQPMTKGSVTTRTNRPAFATLAALLTAAVFSSPSPVSAADYGAPPLALIPGVPGVAAPVATWTGVYIGAHGGVLIGETSGYGATYVDGGNFEAAGTHKELPLDTNALFGLQAGYLHQFGPLVLGGELSASAGAFKSEIAENPPPVGNDYGTRGELGPILAAKGRLGLAFDRFMVYGTGGYAWSHLDFDASFANKDGVDPVTGLPDGSNGTRVRISNSFDMEGFVYGGGFEIALSKTVSLGVEYLHYAWNDTDAAVLTTTNSGITTEKVKADADLDTVTARLNFRF